MNRWIIGLLVLILGVGSSLPALGHGGGLDAYGCHHDRKRGGYHCHRGQFAGQSFASQAEMLHLLQQAPPPTVPREQAPAFAEAKVLRVIDGDTIEVQYQGQRETVRYIGINTPETVDPRKGVEYYGQEAKAVNRRLVQGKTVHLEFDVQRRDKYGRLLAYVYLPGGTFVNAWLVEHGYAQVMTIPPNVKYQDRFLKLQREAREQGRGLWRQDFQRGGSAPTSTPTSQVQPSRGPYRIKLKDASEIVVDAFKIEGELLWAETKTERIGVPKSDVVSITSPSVR